MSLSDNTDPKRNRSQLNWQKVTLIILILLAGLALRIIALGDIFLWNDETDNFDEQSPRSLHSALHGPLSSRLHARCLEVW